MSVYDYSSCFKITFDKPIVTDPLIALPLGTPAKMPMSAIAASSVYGANAKENAFDGSVFTYWNPNSVINEWLSVAYIGPRYVSKVRMYSTSRRIKDFEIQYSDDNATWTTIYTGVATDTSTWQEFSFSCPAAHVYWRILCVSSYTVTTVRIFELEFYCTRQEYSSNGFSVSGQVYDKSPEGTSNAHSYQIRKVTKAEDNYSIYVWLDIADRLKYPVNTVTISYDKALGNLSGALSAQVESFEYTFTPTNYALTFNAHDAERINALITATINLIQIYYIDAKEDETISMQITASAILYHINDIPT